jgi:hypothetical protein
MPDLNNSKDIYPLNLLNLSFLKHCFFLGIYFALGFLVSAACSQQKAENDSFPHTNALVNESSPYLLQHAHNPVDWVPWSESALNEAREKDKLVLVSIGYSSCHWCHVMEKETFQNEAIAALMNDNFINIKVDREERPDVDMVYMTALQLMKGSGGWPLNVVTLPNGKPIYAGTYHTREEWQQVLTQVSDFYRENPEKANEYADMVANGVQEANQIQPKPSPDKLSIDTLKSFVSQWKTSWDTINGGDKGQQKFMMPVNLDFLMNYAVLEADEEALAHIKNTLDKMAMGGIYDQLAGGFFRYSTDQEWKYPHFEKMLYDNAQMISIYSKAYQIFKDPLYEEVVTTTIDFLEREMKNNEGGYYAALNADTDGEEGKYYTWKPEEIAQVLGEDFTAFASYYALSPEDEWEDGKYVLYRQIKDAPYLKEKGISPTELGALKKRWKEKLLNKREQRTIPNKDDKVITSWNALLVNGFLDAYFAFQDSAYLERALQIIDFIDKYCYPKGNLIHSYKEDGRIVSGFLDDYVFMVNARLKLYSATMEVSHLDKAKAMHNKAMQLFYDEASGLFRYNQEMELISTIINTHDGVIASPNAVMAENSFHLGHLLYQPELIVKSEKMVSTVLPLIIEDPSGYSRWNNLLMNLSSPFYEIAVVGDNAGTLLSSLQKVHLPNTLLVGSPQESDLPLFQNRFMSDETYIYVCQNNTCKLPESSPEKVINQLKNQNTP